MNDVGSEKHFANIRLPFKNSHILKKKLFADNVIQQLVIEGFKIPES